MPDQNKNQKTYKQQASEYYNRQYESWMPWVEDQYLKWFTKDNKTSYATKRRSSSSPSPFALQPLLMDLNRTTREDEGHRRRSSR